MRACLTPLGSGRRPGAREHARAGGLQSGLVLGRPRQEAARIAVADDLPARHRDHAVGGRQAALEALLDQHDGGVALLVEPAQQPDQLVAGDRVQLGGGLVQQHQLGPGGERARERHPLQLAAGELLGGAVEQVGDAQCERGFLDRACDRAGGEPAVLQRERDLRAHAGHHHLCLGVGQQRSRVRPDLGGGVLAGVEPGRQHGPAEAAPVEVRHQPAGGAQQRRLARAGEPGDHAELARLDREADVAQGRRGAPG